MSLVSRFPQLAAVPRVSLATLPTPIVQLPRLTLRTGAPVYCKRDDLTSTVYGGNKVRKLEWLLGDARAGGADTLITVGALGSHHVLATATFGTRAGFAVHAILGPQPASPHALENVRADLAAGAVLHAVPTFALVPLAVRALALRLRAQGKRPYVIPGGGSSPVGAVGYVEAGVELADQIDARELTEPGAVFLALGTGGTVAGAAIGLALAGLTTEVVAVRVTSRALANRAALARLVRHTISRLRHFDPSFPDVGETALARIRIEPRELGKGYAIPTDAGRRASTLAAEDGIAVEQTYTAKAVAGLLRDAELGAPRARLYWHTLSSAPLHVENAPDVPRRLARLAQGS